MATTSKQVELLEKTFTTKELAILLAVGNFKRKPKINIVGIGEDDLPSEVLEAIAESIKRGDKSGVFKDNIPTIDSDKECNCITCQLARKIKKLPVIPLSKGGDA